MKLASLWKLIFLNDSDFKMIVCDKEHTLFHVNITPTTNVYHLPIEAKAWDVERISINGGEMHVWVK